ncbi:MAG: TRAP transporter substrate-binding protein DctP [Bacillota bacterium]|nr:TRAP transporter substrate-binding protein DctP [Bacillota bacterium]MDW7683146.1 TRAP transporter substrate-binding protein DctP [Bacillota bacterium]
MRKLFGSKAYLVVLAVVFLSLTLVFAGCGSNDPAPSNNGDNNTGDDNGDGAVLDRKIEQKFASEEIEGDFMTVWAEKYADEMYEWSDGMFDVTVYPYGTLGDTRDINELAQLGIVEYVFSDFAWISAFVPEAQVLALHYIWPEERLPEVIDWVVRNGDSMDILEESFRRNGLVPLSIMYEGWQWVTADRPIRTMADMQGFDVRIMGSALLNENYRAYGASPTAMAYGEVYGGLQQGLIDGQINPLFAIRSMNFYDVQDYFTQIYAEPFLGIPTVNMQFFDSLPEEVQQKMREFWVDAIIPSGEWIDERTTEDLAAMQEERPEIEVIELSKEEVAEFKETAKTIYPKFVEIGGPQAEEILEALQNDIEQAKAALGIE